MKSAWITFFALFLITAQIALSQDSYEMEIPFEEGIEVKPLALPLVKTVEIHGLVQLFFVSSDETTDQFKLRKSELSLKAAITKEADFFIMIDPSKNISESKTVSGTTVRQVKKDGSILQDLGVTLKVLNSKVVVGQFKRPISLAGLQSSGTLELLGRATIVQVFGDKRDMGAMVQGELKTFKLQYMLGLFNGEGANTQDTNDQKDLAALLVYKPLNEALFYFSRYEGTQGANNNTQDRWGVGTRLENGPVLLKVEFLKAQDAQIEKDGWYVLAAYRLNSLNVEALKPVRLALRYEEMDANRSDDAEVHMWTLGGQYLLDEKELSKLAAEVFYLDGKGQEKDDLGLSLGYQGRF